jgi:hypothetical protein
MNNFEVDGVDNNQRFSNTYAISPPPEEIAELNVACHDTGADVSLARSWRRRSTIIEILGD